MSASGQICFFQLIYYYSRWGKDSLNMTRQPKNVW